jgi:hypothetical protein
LHRSLSRQDLQDDENGLRSEPGVSTSEGSLVPDNALAAQHQQLLDALQLTELNNAEHKSVHLDFRSPVASNNVTLPEISFDDVSISSCLSSTLILRLIGCNARVMRLPEPAKISKSPRHITLPAAEYLTT